MFGDYYLPLCALKLWEVQVSIPVYAYEKRRPGKHELDEKKNNFVLV